MNAPASGPRSSANVNKGKQFNQKVPKSGHFQHACSGGASRVASAELNRRVALWRRISIWKFEFADIREKRNYCSDGRVKGQKSQGSESVDEQS
jgi:hypothetical protein